MNVYCALATLITVACILGTGCAPTYASVQELCDADPASLEGATVALTFDRSGAGLEGFATSLVFCSEGEPPPNGACCNTASWAPRFSCSGGPVITVVPTGDEATQSPLLCSGPTGNSYATEGCQEPVCTSTQRFRVVGELTAGQSRTGEPILMLEARTVTALD